MTSTNDRVTTIRTKRAWYWASTGFAALALAAIGAADLTRAPDVIAGLADLGYPHISPRSSASGNCSPSR